MPLEIDQARAAILSGYSNTHKLPAEFAVTWLAAYAKVAAMIAGLVGARHIQTDLSLPEFLDNSLLPPLMLVQRVGVPRIAELDKFSGSH